jgi:hypothetical protein
VRRGPDLTTLRHEGVQRRLVESAKGRFPNARGSSLEMRSRRGRVIRLYSCSGKAIQSGQQRAQFRMRIASSPTPRTMALMATPMRVLPLRRTPTMPDGVD